MSSSRYHGVRRPTDEGQLLTETEQHSPPTTPGINLIGHVTGNLGLAVAARNTLFALSQSGEPFEVIDIDPGAGRGGHDTTYAEHIGSPERAEYGINFFQLNPSEVAYMAQDSPPWLSLADRLNACVPFWELPRLPVKWSWIELLEAVDVVLAPSRFIADAVHTSAPAATVWHYPQAVFLPDGIAADRARFELPESSVLFYLSLDVTSDLSRKNPFAALEAFEQAFPAGGESPDVRLVVKLNNSGTFTWAGESAKRIRDLLADNPRITVIDRAMSYAEVLTLNASCDAYVSLHRAEGLGLNLLEAMSLGKPVIGTAWSGNMDFMTAENSCLVSFDLIPVVSDNSAYQPEAIGPGQSWADPNVAEAAAWMRRLAEDPELRFRIGAKAAADMASLRERFLQGEVFERLEVTRAETMTRKSSAERETQWKPLRRVSFSLRVRRLGVRILRKLGLKR
ncbi:MAG: glycosyltransferase family 4 protein [Coriobacteriia bacterium]